MGPNSQPPTRSSKLFRFIPGVLITRRQARDVLRGLFRFLSCRDSRKWNNLRRRIAVLAKRGLEDQLAVRDFSQSYVGMTHSGSELDEWTMPEGELTDTT